MNHEEVFSMEQEQPSKLLSLSQAEGSIQAENVTEIIELAESIVGGKYHRLTTKNIICKCIDGRNCSKGLEGPNSAGGTLSLLVADDLTSRHFIDANESTADGMARLTDVLLDQDITVGVHTDSHAEGEKSGCGANDQLPKIYAMMVQKAEHIRELADLVLGKPVPQAVHDLIMSRAAERTVFSPGNAVEEAASAKGRSERLEGQHKEIVAVVNLVEGTTLERAALETDTTGSYQAFNIDAWAFEASARAVSSPDVSDEEIESKVVAMTYYNLATALVLCGPDMLVGIRK